MERVLRSSKAKRKKMYGDSDTSAEGFDPEDEEEADKRLSMLFDAGGDRDHDQVEVEVEGKKRRKRKSV